AIKTVRQGDVRCRKYLPAIAHYVQRYAGGTNFSLLQWLAHFSTQVQATLLLGSQFMTALAMLDFKDPTSVFPLLRTAIWTTQLTSNASCDGYAAALSKNDLDKLKGPAMLAQAKAMESMLSDCWAMLQA
ncbi:unnamed protein product, partial [Effrenium voratum]